MQMTRRVNAGERDAGIHPSGKSLARGAREAIEPMRGTVQTEPVMAVDGATKRCRVAGPAVPDPDRLSPGRYLPN